MPELLPASPAGDKAGRTDDAARRRRGEQLIGILDLGPALVSGLTGALAGTVVTRQRGRLALSKRKRGVRGRKVGLVSIPDLLARLDKTWRAMPYAAKHALRAKAAARNYTNYVWFRRHMLNHQRRTGYAAPLSLDLDTGYYSADAGLTGDRGDIAQLTWTDPDLGPQTMDLTNVHGDDLTQTQVAIHCEPPPPPPVPWEHTYTHYWYGPPPPAWHGLWTLVSGSGWLIFDLAIPWYPPHHWEVYLIAGEFLDASIDWQPMDQAAWAWDFTPDAGLGADDSGVDFWPP